MPTRSEFAASIKAKYPAYKDVEDSVLVDKMLEKYPQYRDRVTDDAPAARLGRDAEGAFGEMADQPARSTLTENLFPTASQPSPDRSARLANPIPGTQAPYPMTYEGNVPGLDFARETAGTAGAGAMDVMSLPARGAAAGLTDQKMSDPGAYALRGPAEKAADRQRAEIEGGRAGLMAERNPQNDLARMQMVNPAGTPPELIELAGQIASDPVTYAPLIGPLIKAFPKLVNLFGKGAGFLNKQAGRGAEELSGVPEEALRAWGTKEGRETIKANAGKEYEIGQDLVQRVENFDEYTPEKEEIDKILEVMPGISPEKAIEALRKSKSATVQAPPKPAIVEVKQTREAPTAANLRPEEGPARNRSFDVLAGDPEIKVKQAQEAGKDLAAIPTGDVANKKIDDLMNRLRLIAGEDVHTGKMGKIPAKKYRDIRVSYDQEAKAAFKKDERELLERALVNGRSQMAQDLRDAAWEIGNPDFAAKMEKYSDKLDKLERIKKYLGSNPDTREARGEGFIANLLNANKTSQQNLMKDLEDVFDADFMSRVQGAKWGKQIGKDGEPALFPRQWTGRANLGQTILSTVGVALSSPTAAARGTLPAITWLEKNLTKAGVALSPKAEKAMQALKKPTSEAQKVRLASILAAELEASLPSNAIPFHLQRAAEGDEDPRLQKLRAALERAKDDKTRQRLQAEIDRLQPLSMKGN